MIVLRLGAGHAGDIAMALPAVQALRAAGESVTIDVHPAHRAPFARLGVAWGRGDGALALELPRGTQHRVLAWFDLLQANGFAVDRARRPELPIEGEARAARLLPGGGWVLLAPWSDALFKAWTKWDGWADVARSALDAGYRVAVIGPERAASWAQQIVTREPRVEDLVGMDSPSTWPAMVARAAAVVAPDGGTMHVADALGIRVVALFGPTDPDTWGPYWSPQYVVRAPTVRMDSLAADAVRSALSLALEER